LAYIVDFFGNIFRNKTPGGKWEIVDDDEFQNAKSDGFSCGRNLTDNEIFHMKDLLNK